MENIFETLNEEQKKIVLFLLQDTKSCVVRALAGTGKTWMLKGYADKLKTSEMHKDEAVLWTAPTAVAARQLPSCILPMRGEYPPMTLSRLIKNQQFWDLICDQIALKKIRFLHIVIDEAMMVNAECFGELKRCCLSLCARHRFILVGDDRQLPSVGHSMFISSAFTEFMKDRPALCELQTQVRFGECGDMKTLAKALNDRNASSAHLLLRSRSSDVISHPCPGTPGTIFVTYHNKEVRRLNSAATALHVDSGAKVYTLVWPKSDKIKRFVVGGPVMVTRNLPKGCMTVVNGSTAVFEAVTGTLSETTDDEFPTSRVYKVDKHLEVTIITEDDEEVVLKPRKCPNEKGKDVFLEPAWAITIHKSQGLTFDPRVFKSVVINLNGCSSWEAINVALTRTKQFSQLYIDSSIFALSNNSMSFLENLASIPVSLAVNEFRKLLSQFAIKI